MKTSQVQSNEKSLMDRWTLVAGSGAQRTRLGEVPKFAEGLYDLNGQVYAWMVPNGSWGESNAGLVVGEGESLLVDTQWDVQHTSAMLDAMRFLTDAAPVKYIVNTHADGDHWWGNQLVPQAEIITSRAAYDELLSIKPGSMLQLGRVGKLLSMAKILGANKVGRWFQNMVAPYDFREVVSLLPTRTFEGEVTLEVGGRQVQLIQVGPAHTQGDLLVHVPDARTLYSGDILFLGSTPVMWAGPIDNWLVALDRILDMDIDVIVPGHGPVTDKRGVQQVKAYLEYVNTEVQQRYEAGLSARDAAYDIVLGEDFAQQPFGRWNSPERIMTNVHTLYRHLQGRVDHLGVPQMVNILREQALLAHQLPDAEPSVMRKRERL
jgi:glyoxylase-like metal-dependent hydrolase (beta-lactamase superfamily II)